MKKIIVFCVAFLATMSLWASETSVKNADGVKILYDFDSNTKTASVVAGGGTGNIVIPSTVTYEGEEYSVTSIGNDAFEYCFFLKSVTIPESVTSIGKYAFGNCRSLTSITIPESVTEIGENAFYGTALYNTESNWDNNVLYIDNCLIKAKYIVSGEYIIKEGTRVIGDRAFLGCSLTSITIPEGVTSIGLFAFCGSLTSITIPESVTSIGGSAFNTGRSLTSITCKNTTPPEVDYYYYAFEGVNKSIPLYVPAESVEAYKNAEGWKEFTNIQAIP